VPPDIRRRNLHGNPFPMIRYTLVFVNVVSLALSLISFSSLNRIPPTVTNAIVESTNNLTKDQVISKLRESNLAVDHASNLLWFFLYWWVGISALNLALLIFSSVSNRRIK
jgi:hypothetical protein